MEGEAVDTVRQQETTRKLGIGREKKEAADAAFKSGDIKTGPSFRAADKQKLLMISLQH